MSHKQSKSSYEYTTSYKLFYNTLILMQFETKKSVDKCMPVLYAECMKQIKQEMILTLLSVLFVQVFYFVVMGGY